MIILADTFDIIIYPFIIKKTQITLRKLGPYSNFNLKKLQKL